MDLRDAPRNASIPSALIRLRILPVTTGVAPLTPAVSPLRQLRSLRLFTPRVSRGLPRASRGPLSFAFSCRAFVFTKIQIPFPGTPLFSHPCKTPGGVGGQDVQTFRRGDVPTFRKSKSPALRRGLYHEPKQLTSRSG